MKRFLLFTGDNYYPCGGWEDFYSDFDSAEEAVDLVKETGFDWWHVVDTETMTTVQRR